MTDQELRDRLVKPLEELPIEKASDDTEQILETENVLESTATAVMKSYQDANKWLDILKEELLMTHGCVFFSNYVHNLAHSMPERFDEFGDILHTLDMKVPYPATDTIDTIPESVESIIEAVINILSSINDALVSFSEEAESAKYHAISNSTDELIVDINSELPHIYRMRRIYSGDNIQFDKWVAQYLNNLGTLID